MSPRTGSTVSCNRQLCLCFRQFQKTPFVRLQIIRLQFCSQSQLLFLCIAVVRDVRYFARLSRPSTYPAEVGQLRAVRFQPSGMRRRVVWQMCIDLREASGFSETSIHLTTLRLIPENRNLQGH